MIPKIIHYCWFGNSKKPKIALKCIKSWKRFLPDYKIIEWNEDNFDINSNAFTNYAYRMKKYAFVADYVRLYVLYHYGGIYLDIDVEVIKNLDSFLDEYAFTGFETNEYAVTGIIGSEKGNPLIKEILDYYENIDNFNVLKNWTPNTTIITNIFEKYGLVKNGKTQYLDKYIHIYSSNFFCPLDNRTGKLMITKDTYTIHHFNGSWVPFFKKTKWKLGKVIISIFGMDYYNLFHKNIKNIIALLKRIKLLFISK